MGVLVWGGKKRRGILVWGGKERKQHNFVEKLALHRRVEAKTPTYSTESSNEEN